MLAPKLGMLCLASVSGALTPVIVAHRAPEGRYILEDVVTHKALPAARHAEDLRPLRVTPSQLHAMDRIGAAGDAGLTIRGTRITSRVLEALEHNGLVSVRWYARGVAERAWLTPHGEVVLAARKGV